MGREKPKEEHNEKGRSRSTALFLWEEEIEKVEANQNSKAS